MTMGKKGGEEEEEEKEEEKRRGKIEKWTKPRTMHTKKSGREGS